MTSTMRLPGLSQLTLCPAAFIFEFEVYRPFELLPSSFANRGLTARSLHRYAIEADDPDESYVHDPRDG